MAYKLIEAAQSRWRAVNAALVALVCNGATFHEGEMLERPADITPHPTEIDCSDTMAAP
jgi:putative transposase